MATLISSATGDFTAPSTWKVADPVSLLDTNATSTATTTSYVASQNFMPGAITVDAFAINVVSRIASPVGTLSVELYNSTGAASVQVITVNVSDLDVEGGWHCCSFTPILLLAATNYQIRVKSSIASEVTVYRSATAGNWSRFLRTTTTAAPGAGDNLQVCGQHNGTSLTSYVVTMDNTSATIFGTIVANGFPLQISKGGSFVCGAAASTNYRFRLSGVMRIHGTGVFNWGTAGTPIPATSTARLEFNVTTNVDSGFEIDKNATYETCGSQLRTVNRCFLAVDAAAGATVLTTDVALGAKAGDRIVIAPTNRTITEAETFVLGVDTSGTTLTLPSGLTYGHSGTVGRRAEIINVTRNVVITGTSQTLCAYVNTGDATKLTSAHTEYTMLGSGTTNKRGIDIAMTTNLASFDNCSFHSYYNVGSTANGIHPSVAGARISVTNSDFWDTNYIGIYWQLDPAGAGSLIDECWLIGRGIAGSYSLLMSGRGPSVTNIRVAGWAALSFTLASGGYFGTLNNILAHSCTNGPLFNGVGSTTATNVTSWRTGGQGIQVTSCVDFVLEVLESVGHASSSLTMTSNKNCRIKVAVAKGETGFTQAYSVYDAGLNMNTVVYDSVFGDTGAPGAATNGDIVTTALNADVAFQNTQFLSPTEFYISIWGYGLGYRSEKHDGIAGNNKYVRWEGTINRDTTIYDTGGTASMRMTPTQSAVKLRSDPSFSSSVLSGGSLIPSVRVRKSVVGDGTAYNGNQPRLMVRSNPVAGIMTDTVIATASGAAGSWETLSGTTAAVTENTRLDFYVDCDGTTGWVNVDNFSVGVEDTSTMDFWYNGTPYVIGFSSSTANFTDVPTDKVELGYAYKYNSGSNNRTGTRRQPTVGEVHIGTLYGPSDTLTGTYDGSDRWSDPGIANVRNLTTYKANSTVDNRTGNVVEALTATVLGGITYGTLSSLTGTLVSPTAAQIRTEIDTNSTQLAAIKAKTDNLPADPADNSDILGAISSIPAAPSPASNAAAVWSAIVEGAFSYQDFMRLMGGVLVGKVSGANTGTETFRDVSDTKDRIVATVDTNGNRTAITKDTS